MKTFSNSEALSKAYVALISAKARHYCLTRVVFDNYSVAEQSLKEGTRARRRGTKATPVRGYKVEDATKIKDAKSFLGNTTTKDDLTQYLAQKLRDDAHIPIIAATHKGVLSNTGIDTVPGASSQEEADTLMMLHAVEASREGLTVHVYSQDTDVLLLAIRRVPLLGENPAMLMGTKDRRRLIELQPI